MTKYKFEDVATVVTAQIHLVPDGFPKKMSRYYKYCNKNNILMPFLPTDTALKELKEKCNGHGMQTF